MLRAGLLGIATLLVTTSLMQAQMPVERGSYLSTAADLRQFRHPRAWGCIRHGPAAFGRSAGVG
jgi:hypothetical protein